MKAVNILWKGLQILYFRLRILDKIWYSYKARAENGNIEQL